MSYLATTRGALIRGTTTDPLGDDVDANGGSPVAGCADMPVSIIEKTKQVFDPASGQRRTVRYAVGRVPATTPVAEGDRLRDNRTMTIYNINEVTAVPRSIAGQSSLTLDLTKTGA